MAIPLRAKKACCKNGGDFRRNCRWSKNKGYPEKKGSESIEFRSIEIRAIEISTIEIRAIEIRGQLRLGQLRSGQLRSGQLRLFYNFSDFFEKNLVDSSGTVTCWSDSENDSSETDMATSKRELGSISLSFLES